MENGPAWYCPACGEECPDRATLRYHEAEEHGSAPILEAERAYVTARPYEDILLPEPAS